MVNVGVGVEGIWSEGIRSGVEGIWSEGIRSGVETVTKVLNTEVRGYPWYEGMIYIRPLPPKIIGL